MTSTLQHGGTATSTDGMSGGLGCHLCRWDRRRRRGGCSDGSFGVSSMHNTGRPQAMKCSIGASRCCQYLRHISKLLSSRSGRVMRAMHYKRIPKSNFCGGGQAMAQSVGCPDISMRMRGEHRIY